MNMEEMYVASGFKEDCEQLISRFEQTNDIRFETFCKIWKSMKFTSIFRSRMSDAETYEFCDEALHISKQFLVRPVSFKARIAGLYLVYCVYYEKQAKPCRIKLKMEEWQNIMELHTQIKEGEHLDANYILSRLIVDEAFHFCLFNSEFGLEKHLRLKQKRHRENPFSVVPAMKSMIEPGSMLTQLNDLSNLYYEKRCSILKDKDPDINLYNHDITEEILTDISTLIAERKRKQDSPTLHQRKKFDYKRNYDLFYNLRHNVLNKIREKVKCEEESEGTEDEIEFEDSDMESISDSNPELYEEIEFESPSEIETVAEEETSSSENEEL